ncbi:efflux RND transporter periplasmic adaptor subunit [Curvibacter delicatus]|jgi:cobalt-zinc-cadmium efflux system membrane fusion protein|uniref:efflux RND transporter periplasmic adaptor subunit n=1 Tax=Curvibacter delicatus TaxID=80879 RepID=UPI00082FF8FB|nr:efflux RND transporter periplasmic adaptor subunit [Curvibacter delicatus]
MLNRFLPVLLLSALGLSACTEAPAPKVEAPAPIVQNNQLRFAAGHPQLNLLHVAAAAPAKAMTVELPAKLVWNEERTQRIYPAFAGRVMGIKADVGQKVLPGTPLALLASPDFGQAQSETAKAEADARLTHKALQRQRELFEAGIVARKELEQAETDADRAQAEVARAQARTRLYGSGSGVNQQLALSASISGVVVERNLNPGQEVRPDLAGPGVPALFVVTDPSSLWIQIDARESEVGIVHPGTAFELSIPSLPGQTFQGKVIATSDFIDPLTRTIKIRGVVANADRRLKAEMLATAKFERTFESGVVVPAVAVLLRGTRHSVFVQTRPGEFERRAVELDYEGPREVVIAKGLQAGEQVVVENALLLARLLRLAEEEARAPDNAAAAATKSVAPGAAADTGAAQK